MSIKSVANKIGHRNLPVYYLGRAALRNTAAWIMYNRMADGIGTAARTLAGNRYQLGMTRDHIAINPYGRIILDGVTRSIVEEIGTRKGDTNVAGLINFKTGETLLRRGFDSHLLSSRGFLQTLKRVLSGNWHGFYLIHSDSEMNNINDPAIKVCPFTRQLGGIPLEYRSIFENHIKKLLENTAKTIKFLPFYKRTSLFHE
jgi:hypothetical protein